MQRIRSAHPAAHFPERSEGSQGRGSAEGEPEILRRLLPPQEGELGLKPEPLPIRHLTLIPSPPRGEGGQNGERRGLPLRSFQNQNPLSL